MSLNKTFSIENKNSLFVFKKCRSSPISGWIKLIALAGNFLKYYQAYGSQLVGDDFFSFHPG